MSKKLIIEFTFDEDEWDDYSDVVPELVWEDVGFDLKHGMSMKILSSEGFAEEEGEIKFFDPAKNNEYI